MKGFIFLLLLIAPRAWSLDIVFGPEFTFGYIDGSPGDPLFVQKQMLVHLVRGQPEAAKFNRVELKNDAVRFESPNGWDATVSKDPGVVEVQMSPMSVENFEKYKDDIQDAIFASAANTDQWPLLWQGGGHINLSVEAFRFEPLLLRNFIVDLYNHNELFMGVLGYDTHSALSWNMHPQKRERFQQVLDEFDRGNFEFGFGGFTQAVNNVLNKPGLKPEFLWESVRLTKEYAVNFEEIVNGRLELRAVRPQASMDVWVRQIRLIRNRLLYLQKLGRPLAIDQKVAVQSVDEEKHLLEPPVEAQAAMRAFYTYATEAGERWQDHRDYLWPKWGWDGEIEKFENSRWFKQQESHKSCEKRLVGAK